MRNGTTSSISGSGSQFVLFELEEVSQHSYWTVPFQKPDSLRQEPFLLWVPTRQWDGHWAVRAAEPVGRISACYQGVGSRLRVGAVNWGW